MDAVEEKTEAQQQQQQGSEMIPKERLDELNSRLAAAEELNETLSRQMALVTANATGPRTQQQQIDEFEAAGIKVEDPEMPLSAAEVRKLEAYRAKQYQNDLADLHFKLDHPDFAQIVGTPEQIASGDYAEPLKAAIKDDPTIAQKIAASGNPRIAAYNIAKIYAQRGSKTSKPDAEEEAKQAIQEAMANAEKPKSASAASGQAGIDSGNKVAAMSDAEFEAYKERVKNGL